MRRPINGHMRCLLRWKEGIGDIIGDRGSLSAATTAGVSSGFELSSSDIAHSKVLKAIRCLQIAVSFVPNGMCRSIVMSAHIN